MTGKKVSPYMICLELPPINEEMAALIPAQRAMVNRLFMDGILLSYSLSQDRKMLWCVIMADSEPAATALVASFPLHPWFRDWTVHPLLFHNAMPSANLPVSLN